MSEKLCELRKKGSSGGGGGGTTSYLSQALSNGQSTSAISLNIGDVFSLKNPLSKLVYSKDGGAQITDNFNADMTVLSSGNFQTLAGNMSYAMAFVCLASGSYVFKNSSGGNQLYAYPDNN